MNEYFSEWRLHCMSTLLNEYFIEWVFHWMGTSRFLWGSDHATCSTLKRKKNLWNHPLLTSREVFSITSHFTCSIISCSTLKSYAQSYPLKVEKWLKKENSSCLWTRPKIKFNFFVVCRWLFRLVQDICQKLIKYIKHDQFIFSF